jgi:hypothetical protein
MKHSHSTSTRLKVAAFLAALSLVAGGVVACNSALTTGTSTSSGPCAQLAACCNGAGAPPTCQAELSAATGPGGSASACTDVLEAYQAGGSCGGTDGGVIVLPDGAIVAVGADAGTSTLPCALTGTCDAGATGTTNCTALGSCNDGLTYDTCVTTAAGGFCSAVVRFSNGLEIACASCSDCSAAATEAETACGSGVVDSGPPPPVPDCGSPPSLHTELEAGTYCPFTPTGSVHCGAGQQCCEPTAGDLSSCQAGGSTCPVTGSLVWECSDPLDCQGYGTGTVCCATGTTAYDSTCGYYRGSGMTGSQCAATCGAGQIQICSATSGCTTGTCTPFKVAGLVIGTCL